MFNVCKMRIKKTDLNIDPLLLLAGETQSSVFVDAEDSCQADGNEIGKNARMRASATFAMSCAHESAHGLRSVVVTVEHAHVVFDEATHVRVLAEILHMSKNV